MPAKWFKFPGVARVWLAGLAVASATSACAPDMMQLGRSKDLDAYLDKIVKNCGSMYINDVQVWQFADDTQEVSAGDDSYFFDQASMLLYGTITPEQYIADMSGYFDDMSPRGMKSYQCIIAQLPQQAPPLPKAYREVMKAAPQVSGGY